MKRAEFTLTTAMVGVGVLAALPAMAVPTGYSLGTNGHTLVTMSDLDNPGNVNGVTLSDGVRLNALAFRPNTGQLYGYSQQNHTVYEVDPQSGVVAAVAMLDADDPGVNVGEIGFDFNNFLDAARIVSTDDDNLVFFPENDPANVVRVTSLEYNAGDDNEGVDPSVFSNAYTNAVSQDQLETIADTVQYVLDSELDILGILNNNEGTIDTIGQLSVDGVNPIDFSATGGFDIFTPAFGTNIGYTLLSTVTGEGLYSFDSFTLGDSGFIDTAFLGNVGTDFGILDGLAVFEPAVIPVPAGGVLLLTALGTFGALRRRRAAA